METLGYTAIAVIACGLALACCLYLRAERGDRRRDLAAERLAEDLDRWGL